MAMNVLVVDDSDVIRSMILKTLRLADVPVSTAYEASNGREALAILEDNWVDVVLADINMPVMDGLEMLRRMRAHDQLTDVPVIVVSTEASTERIAQLGDSGVTAYVKKPFTPEAIRDVVDHVTRGIRTDPSEAAVRAAFEEVLARFVLLDGVPADDGAPPPDMATETLLVGRMIFRGPVSGSLTMAAPLSLCKEMAANAMGVEVGSDLVANHAGDALGEVLNMTCGCLVLALEPDAPTDLTPPLVVRLGREDWECLSAATTTLSYVVEGRPALLSCTLRHRQTAS